MSHEKQLTVNIIGDEMGAYSVAYSPVSNFGIQAGAGHKSGHDNGTDESYFNPNISAGYYKMVAPNSLLEVYGGAGVYTYKNNIDVPVKKINFSNYFIQPSFAFLNKNIDVAFTIRADYFKRNNTIINSNQPPDTSTFQYSFLKYTNYLFIQPGITVRAGIKNVKFQLQVSKSYPFNKKYNSIYGLMYSSNINPGYLSDNKVKLAIGIMVDFEDITGSNKK
ncbi:MAG TPA: hypothetical protein VMY77_08375 [Chitinophagaceae bacterium]|nr:hypothetical protein [Chitinophagaceae bacterium]